METGIVRQTVRTEPKFVGFLRTWSSFFFREKELPIVPSSKSLLLKDGASLACIRFPPAERLGGRICLRYHQTFVYNSGGDLMINRSTLAAILILGMTGSAFAQTCNCPAGTGNRLNQTQIGNLLPGNTVCVGNSPTWQAQEQHLVGGVLKDFKRGPTDPTDPTATVGSWLVSGNGNDAVVTYNYGSASYSYGVCSPGGPLTNGKAIGFCPAGSGTATSGTLRLGAVGCS